MAVYPNYIYDAGSRAVRVNHSQIITISAIGEGVVNIYTIPNMSDKGAKLAFAAKPQISPGTTYSVPVSSGERMFLLEPVGGVCEWTIGAAAIPTLATSSPVFLARTDSSGTPGNATANTPRGKSAIAIGASTCVITNSLMVLGTECVQTQLRSVDATATILTVVPAVGSFTVTSNANATAATIFEWVVFA